MYLAFFGLRELPFNNTPDTGFFFAHASCREALNTLLVAARSGEGFIKVVGEVGTGKTLLCRKFLSELDHRAFITAYIPNPYLEPMTLLFAVADELQIAYPEDVNQHQLLKLLTRCLVGSYAAGRRVVLTLDEAQAMPVETLEALRLLSNLETERRKLLQIVLFGQPELDARLREPAVRQLKQRIGFACRLAPLDRAGVADYVAHRLNVAGYTGPRLFTERALARVFRASRGVPRLVNILAHKAMMAAFGEGAREVNHRHVALAIADTESAGELQRARRFRFVQLATALAATLLFSAGALLYWRGLV